MPGIYGSPCALRGDVDARGRGLEVGDGDLSDLGIGPPWQGEGEAAADTQPALAPDATAMGLDQTPADIETDAGPAVGAGRCAVELEEALEETRNVTRVDARAPVAHRHFDFVSLVPDLHDDIAFGVLQGVVEEVGE